MYICMCVGTYIYIYMSVCVCVYMYLSGVCKFICIYVCVCRYVCLCVYVCTFVCRYICMYVHMCVCVCVYTSMYVCMYVCILFLFYLFEHAPLLWIHALNVHTRIIKYLSYYRECHDKPQIYLRQPQKTRVINCGLKHILCKVTSRQ